MPDQKSVNKPKLTPKQAKFVRGIALGKPDKHDRYIYLAYSNGYYKIGVANNPQNRVLSMATGNPFGISLIHARKLKEATYFEKLIHILMPEDIRYRGEWYKLNKYWLKRIYRLLNDLESLSYGNK